MKLILWIIFLNVYLKSMHCLLNTHNNPYYIHVQKISRCKRMGRHSLVYDTNIYNVNSTHQGYIGNFTVKTKISNEMKIRIIAWMLPSGENKKWINAIDATVKACDGFDRFAKNILTDIFKASGAEYHCPVEAGNYFINNYIINFERMTNIPNPSFGELKFNMLLYSMNKNKRILESCMDVHLLVTRERMILKNDN
ncbi:uncharacterized protein LOC142320572 [Lycorma delicatula]|uniref:uncharacterized protein LOC142320572 n=1 Tax=Lycorma delicatula TaxID=130591 RepID=UPI003F50E3E8